MKAEMTAQEIFDEVTKHLFDQKAASLNEFGGCVYRGKDGFKCAVGALISDELALVHNGASVVKLIHLAEDEGVTVPNWMTENLSLLTDLQTVHDACPLALGEFVPSELKRRLERVSVQHNLSPEILSAY
jgi:hypothetical protein